MSSHWLRRLRWAAIGWVVVFWRLGYSSLLDPDEAHYAELTREMLHSGSWLVPLLDGRPYIDKPVLFHWLQGVSVLLLGETEFAARLPSALSAFALIALTRWVGVVFFGARVGEWGAIMFATIPATFALSSVALFDMVFTTFLFGGLGCLLVAAKQSRFGIELAGYGLLTLAVMTKGPVALVLVALFIAVALIAGGNLRSLVARLHWKTGLAAVIVAASPWFLWMYWRFGPVFVGGYLMAGNLFYFTQPAIFSRRAVSHVFYARAFAGAFFPWSAIAVGRGLDALRSRRLRLTADEAALWLWVVVVVGFFSVARFKLDHYIFPAAPACCLLAARAWFAAADDGDRPLWLTRISVFGVAAVMVVAGSFGSVYLFKVGLDLPTVSVVLPIALAVGGAALLAQAARRHWRVPSNAMVPVVTLLAVYVVVVAVGFPVLERTRPTSLVGRYLARNTGATAPVGLFRLERLRASLRYYAERPVTRIESADELRTFLAQPRQVYVVLRRSEFTALREAGLPIHLVRHYRAVVGTTGRGLRRQVWGFLFVTTNVPPRHRVDPPVD